MRSEVRRTNKKNAKNAKLVRKVKLTATQLKEKTPKKQPERNMILRLKKVNQKTLVKERTSERSENQYKQNRSFSK